MRPSQEEQNTNQTLLELSDALVLSVLAIEGE
jgi:hypothetical protein